ncbi:MAG: hypothetical protein Q7T82_11820 [Armatimonadota bacterium]|nr:hypothetical protein [Armatimonadota bacterium]
MIENRDTEGLTPAQERAAIGTPAGEDAAKGRRRHGTRPLTEAAGFSEQDREREAVLSTLEADQTAEPERTGEHARGIVTEEALEEEIEP